MKPPCQRFAPLTNGLRSRIALTTSAIHRSFSHTTRSGSSEKMLRSRRASIARGNKPTNGSRQEVLMPEFHQRSVTLLTTLGPGIRAIRRHPILASGRQRSDDVWGCGSRPRRCRKLGYVAAVGVLPDAAVESGARRDRRSVGDLDAVGAHVRRRRRGHIETRCGRRRRGREQREECRGIRQAGRGSPRSGREYRRPPRPGWWRMIPSKRMRCAPQRASRSARSPGWCRSNRGARMRCNWFRWRRRSMRPRRPSSHQARRTTRPCR